MIDASMRIAMLLDSESDQFQIVMVFGILPIVFFPTENSEREWEEVSSSSSVANCNTRTLRRGMGMLCSQVSIQMSNQQIVSSFLARVGQGIFLVLVGGCVEQTRKFSGNEKGRTAPKESSRTDRDSFLCFFSPCHTNFYRLHLLFFFHSHDKQHHHHWQQPSSRERC